MSEKIDKSFNVSYTFKISGKTKSDGVKTITPQMIRDKLLNELEIMLRGQYIEKYSVTAEIDHEKKDI